MTDISSSTHIATDHVTPLRTTDGPYTSTRHESNSRMLDTRIKQVPQGHCEQEDGNCGERLSIEIQRAAFKRLLDENHLGKERIRDIIIRAWRENFMTATAAFDMLYDEGLLGTHEDLLEIYVAGVAALQARQDAEAIALSRPYVESAFEAAEPSDALPIAPPPETLLEALANGRNGNV